MKVEFDATLDDFVDLANRVSERSKALKSSRRKLIGFCAVMCGFVFVISAHGFGSLWADVIVGCIGALISVAVYSALLRIIRPLFKGRFRALYREQYGTDGPIRVEVEITESEILVRQHGIQIVFGWKSVRAIEERGDSIELWRPGGPLIVRGRAFDSMEKRSEFLDLCKKWFNLSRGSSATPSEG